MSDLKLTMTFADYTRLWRMATGEVRPEGIDLDYVRGPRPQMLTRAAQDPAVAGGESSLGQHVRRVDVGDRSLVGLPIFVLRNFALRDLYIRRDSGIQEPKDLIGKHIGMYQWTASGSVWYRHMLRWLGVSLDSLRWTIGPIDEVGSGSAVPNLPDRVVAAPEGRFLADMLVAGELDAIYSPLRPRGYDPVSGPLVRLVPNFRPVEQAYYRETRVYPPQHLVIVRRAVWDANPWIGKRLLAAFDEAERQFNAGQRFFPYSTPWLEAELEDTVALMGEDYHPHGLGDGNRQTLDAFCEMAHVAGLTKRRVQVDELFAEFLAT